MKQWPFPVAARCAASIPSRVRGGLVLLGAALWLMAACSEHTVDLVQDPVQTDTSSVKSDASDLDRPTPDAAPRDAGHAATLQDAANPADSSAPHQPIAHCGTRPCACDDGEDNDGDGLSDGLDPECTGAFDEDEATFGIGQPNKQNQCRDCFWDGNAGFDDGCRYPAECLTGTALKGRGNCSSCEVSQGCLDSCRVRTPNGCDCFGCCEVQRGSERVFIELNDSCDLSQLDDASACPRCVPSTQCANPCGRCELCLGKRPSDLPADCAASTPGAPAYNCEDGLRVCTTSSDCVGASYCLLGCCLIDLL